MSNETSLLKQKILELEEELKFKNAELLRYRQEISKVNLSLDKVMGQLTQELKSAQSLQKILTPTELPSISGFEWSTKFIPGTRFGGDYFDIFEHEDKLKFGIFMSSSNGYTMSAILMAVMLKLSSQIEARKGMPAEQVVQKISQEVIRQISAKESASLFYAIINRRTFELQYCSVGNIVGLLQQPGKEVLIETKPCAKAIGKGFSEEFQSVTIPLNAKERLIIASPGITQTANSQEKLWEIDGLISAIRKAPRQGVHELRNEILFQSEQFAQKIPSSKDQTLIVMEVKDKIIKLAK